MTAEMVKAFEVFKLRNMEEHGFGPSIMKSIKVCKECGTVASSKNTICKKCEAELPSESVYHQYVKMHSYCCECDTVVPHNAHYCPQCGGKLEKINQVVMA